jgi:hypothetical protein
MGPRDGFLRDKVVYLADLRRGEGAGKRRRRTCRECQRWCILEEEVTDDFAIRPPLISKSQNVPVLKLMNNRRIVNLDQLLTAIMVRDGNEQIEPLARRQQGSQPVSRLAHRSDRGVHELGHVWAAERRLEPSRSHEEREFAADLWILDGLPKARGPQQPDNGFEN